MPSGQARDYPPKRSGSTRPVEGWQANGILGGIRSAMMMPTIMVPVGKTNGVNVHRSGVIPQTVMDCMIWPVTFGNGARIGMEGTIIVVLQQRTHLGQTEENTECCGAGLGAAVLTTCG